MKAASRVDLEPTSEDDWELVEIHADHIEEQLLNQVEQIKSCLLVLNWQIDTHFEFLTGLTKVFLRSQISC